MGCRVTYEQWISLVPESMKKDAIWKIEAYRLAVFLVDLAWYDVTKLMRDKRLGGHVGQLYRSVGSISANISEGYSRATGRERARFYEFALGSARESRDWYYQSRHVLRDQVADHRIDLLTQIIRLLLTMVPEQRRSNHRVAQPRPTRLPAIK
jgi:four helix bundle protein